MEKCIKQKILSPEPNHSSPQPHLSSQRESLLLFCVFFRVFLKGHISTYMWFYMSVFKTHEIIHKDLYQRLLKVHSGKRLSFKAVLLGFKQSFLPVASRGRREGDSKGREAIRSPPLQSWTARSFLPLPSPPLQGIPQAPAQLFPTPSPPALPLLHIILPLLLISPPSPRNTATFKSQNCFLGDNEMLYLEHASHK